MYTLTKKTLDILDILEYPYDRVFNDSSKNWWTIWKTAKFIALGMTKDEWVEKWFLELLPDNPLHKLCKTNSCIPHAWIQKNLTEDQYDVFLHWMEWQGQSEYGVYAHDVKRFLEINSL